MIVSTTIVRLNQFENRFRNFSEIAIDVDSGHTIFYRMGFKR